MMSKIKKREPRECGVMAVVGKMPDRKLAAVHRVAKTRLAAFFRDPHSMIALRNELEARAGLRGGK